MNKWELQIRKGSQVLCQLFPFNDQEHQRVTLREGCSFWKRYYEPSDYKGIPGSWGEWREHRMNPGQYIIILGYNDCVINTDTQYENLLKELALLRNEMTLQGRQL